MAERQVGIDERRARLAIRHRLVPSRKADHPAEAARSLIALHGTDPASVYMSARARMTDASVAGIERALYDERSLVRLLAMRRTMWVTPVELAPTVFAGGSLPVAAQQRKRLVKVLEEKGGVKDAGPWLTKLEDKVLAALEKRGEAPGVELSKDVPELRTEVVYAEGKAYGGPTSITSQVLNLMSMDGRIVRARPRGTWISTQYLWSPLTKWLPGGVHGLGTAEAQVELVRLWLEAFGPAPLADLKWWTGWTVAAVRKALSALDVATVVLPDGTDGLLLASDLEPVTLDEPWIALLPPLDPTPMGWKERSWFLSEELRARLFDTMGNIGPTIWCDGQIVGGWSQTSSGVIALRLFTDIGNESLRAIEAEAGGLESWLGESRPVPRFRTPLERELRD